MDSEMMKLILPDKANSKFSSLLSRKSYTFVWEIPNFFHKLQEIEDNPSVELKCHISYSPEFVYALESRIYYSQQSCCPCLEWRFVKPVYMTAPNIYYRIIVALLDRRAGVEEERNYIAIFEPAHSQTDSNSWLENPTSLLLSACMTNSNDIEIIPGNFTVVTLVEPLSVLYKLVRCDDGSLTWRCDNFKKKKDMLVSKHVPYVASEYFYSSEIGYRMQLRMKIDSTHIYILMCLLRGKYDAILDKNPHFNTTVTIVNQLRSESEDDNLETSAMTETSFQLHDVENERFLRNDTLVISVEVTRTYPKIFPEIV